MIGNLSLPLRRRLVCVVQTSKYKVTGRAVEFELSKAGEGAGEVWPRLIRGTQRLGWLRTNFDHFAFEDSEPSEAEDDMTVCRVWLFSLYNIRWEL